MAKVLPFVENGDTTGWMIMCPACDCGHLFNIKANNPNGVGGHKPTWTFNGKEDSPTFRASMLVRSGIDGKMVCHSFVTDGKIEFLGDCTHGFAGQTVALPDFATGS